MAFTVEDGTIVTNANAYITVAYMRAHFLDRGVDLSAILDATLQPPIVRATDYVDKRFSQIFKGWKSQSVQSLEHPRTGMYDDSGYWIESDTIHPSLKRAIAEYSYIAYLLTDLLPLPAVNFNVIDPATGTVTAGAAGAKVGESSKVGPISESITYSDASRWLLQNRASGVFSPISSTGNLPEYPVADEWLKVLIKIGRGVQLERA